MIRCSNCSEGKMVPGRVQNYDATSLVGLDAVILHTMPVLKCDHCDHLMFEGHVVESITRELAAFIVRQGEELRPKEVRFLRELFVMTQADLAERLGVTRATVNRWEAGDDPVGTLQSFALRTLTAWSLNDAALAREVGELWRQTMPQRSAPPYHLNGIPA
jgi:putative zinc finger/helix-turn-helix YgiT family protein